jgi:hypothetical protein
MPALALVAAARIVGRDFLKFACHQKVDIFAYSGRSGSIYFNSHHVQLHDRAGSDPTYDQGIDPRPTQFGHRVAIPVGVLRIGVVDRSDLLLVRIYNEKSRRRAEMVIDGAFQSFVYRNGEPYLHSCLLKKS